MRRNGFPHLAHVALLGILTFMALAAPAQARWLKVETDKFVVYGEGSEKAIRDYAVRLTTYDTVLRIYHPATANRVPSTKVQVVMLGQADTLRRIQPNIPKYAAGLYIAMNEGVFAFAIKDGSFGQDDVLFHEYAHHFMLENFPNAYPAWFVEGWAEYFMTTEIDGLKVKVGGYNPSRAYSIFNERWLPLDQILSSTTGETKPERRFAYYAQAWLLMHYMRSDPARARQLDAATRAISEGDAPVKAFEKATGLTMAELTLALKQYRKLPATTMTLNALETPAMSVTPLPPSADELFIDNLHLILAPTGKSEPELLQNIRRKAAKYPGDALAERVLARAEFVMGDGATGEAIMTRRLAAKADDKEDLLLAGTGQIMIGMRDATQQDARYKAARAGLGKAYQLDKTDFRTLYAYALSRSIEPKFPTDNDLTVLLEARALAPSVTELSARAGFALLSRGRREEAARMLAVVINNPHGGQAAEQARRALNQGQIGKVDIEPFTGEDEPATAPEPGKPKPLTKAR